MPRTPSVCGGRSGGGGPVDVQGGSLATPPQRSCAAKVSSPEFGSKEWVLWVLLFNDSIYVSPAMGDVWNLAVSCLPLYKGFELVGVEDDNPHMSLEGDAAERFRGVVEKSLRGEEKQPDETVGEKDTETTEWITVTYRANSTALPGGGGGGGVYATGQNDGPSSSACYPCDISDPTLSALSDAALPAFGKSETASDKNETRSWEARAFKPDAVKPAGAEVRDDECLSKYASDHLGELAVAVRILDGELKPGHGAVVRNGTGPVLKKTGSAVAGSATVSLSTVMPIFTFLMSLVTTPSGMHFLWDEFVWAKFAPASAGSVSRLGVRSGGMGARQAVQDASPPSEEKTTQPKRRGAHGETTLKEHRLRYYEVRATCPPPLPHAAHRLTLLPPIARAQPLPRPRKGCSPRACACLLAEPRPREVVRPARGGAHHRPWRRPPHLRACHDHRAGGGRSGVSRAGLRPDRAGYRPDRRLLRVREGLRHPHRRHDLHRRRHRGDGQDGAAGQV